MAPHGACGQLTDEFGFGRLSDICQIIVNNQAVGAALQADWFHRIKSLLFVTNNFYVETSTSRTSPPQRNNNTSLPPFFFALRALYAGYIPRDSILLLVQVLYTRNYAQWNSIHGKWCIKHETQLNHPLLAEAKPCHFFQTSSGRLLVVINHSS